MSGVSIVDEPPPAPTTDVTPREGNAFAVPLPALGRWTLGVVSRTSARWPHLMLAHYFPFRLTQRPAGGELPSLAVDEAALICRTSDLALRDGSWPLIGQLPEWSRRDWPMPRFAVPPHRPGDCWQIEVYRDNDPGHLMRTVPVADPAQASGLPEGSVAGGRIIIQRLTRLFESADCAFNLPGHAA